MFEINGQGKQLLTRPRTTPGKTTKRPKTTKPIPRLPAIKYKKHLPGTTGTWTRTGVDPAATSKGKLDISTSKKKLVVVKTPIVKIDKTCDLSIVEEAEELLAAPEQPHLNGTGFVKIRFNHYNKLFPIHNGVLKWADVDEDYCISFVFRGKYTRNLRQELGGEGRNIQVSETDAKRDEMGKYFLGLLASRARGAISSNGDDLLVTYRLMLEEDPEAGIGAEGLRIREGPLSSLDRGSGGKIQSGNKAVGDITKALLNMKTSELHSQEAADMRERRDLEDILYS
jgi:hypothetical protein